ncbi:MAG: glycosyltransferase family 2 protein [Candidatus Roizmanbacteria bacterium]|nr:glycosyltransferase family 2 protein [Candidatus Roizmanbacteria bacterium]
MSTKLVSVSVCMAVHNEEDRIGSTLEQVIDWVDEVVIIDGESTDKTVQVAQSFGKKVRVYHEKNAPNFIANKQKAIERAKSAWTLELDADELVTDALKDEIRQAVITDNVGFRIPRLNHFLGKPLKKGGQYPDLKFRLYRSGFAQFPSQSVHDEAALISEHAAEPTGQLSSPLLHYPYASIAVYMRKTIQYAQFEADVLYEKGVRPSVGLWIQYYIGKPLYWFGLTYVRHRGYVDGFPGFAFSLFSSIRYWFEYAALYERSTRT